ncbi:4143_t:CDS:2, partial [Racocetra fulgida]
IFVRNVFKEIEEHKKKSESFDDINKFHEFLKKLDKNIIKTEGDSEDENEFKLEFTTEDENEFKLEFTTVSELNTNGNGSFCGMFWLIPHKSIVIVFKGTTPSNFSEWLVNSTFQCIDARLFLFGQIHKGFYKCLFPTNEKTAASAYANFTCERILKAVVIKAKEILNKNNHDGNK